MYRKKNDLNKSDDRTDALYSGYYMIVAPENLSEAWPPETGADFEPSIGKY